MSEFKVGQRVIASSWANPGRQGTIVSVDPDWTKVKLGMFIHRYPTDRASEYLEPVEPEPQRLVALQGGTTISGELTRTITTIEEFEALFGPLPGMRRMLERQPLRLHVPSQAASPSGASISPLAVLEVSLHTASAGDAGNQTTNETAYTSYEREAAEAKPPDPLPMTLPPGTRTKSGVHAGGARRVKLDGRWLYARYDNCRAYSAWIAADDIDWSTVAQAEAAIRTEPAPKRFIVGQRIWAPDISGEYSPGVVAADYGDGWCELKMDSGARYSVPASYLVIAEPVDTKPVRVITSAEETEERAVKEAIESHSGSAPASAVEQPSAAEQQATKEAAPASPPPGTRCACGQELTSGDKSWRTCGECRLRVDVANGWAPKHKQPPDEPDVEQPWEAWATSGDES